MHCSEQGGDCKKLGGCTQLGVTQWAAGYHKQPGCAATGRGGCGLPGCTAKNRGTATGQGNCMQLERIATGWGATQPPLGGCNGPGEDRSGLRGPRAAGVHCTRLGGCNGPGWGTQTAGGITRPPRVATAGRNRAEPERTAAPRVTATPPRAPHAAGEHRAAA